MRTYSKKELQEFKDLILKKRQEAIDDYDFVLQRLNGNNTKDTDPLWLNANNAVEVTLIEELSRDAERLLKFINSLTSALARIENGTYGVCQKTGELIPKERLMAVPHATLSVNAKLGIV